MIVPHHWYPKEDCMRTLLRTACACAAALVLVAWTSAPVGPPWISIEHPPSPYDATTRGAFLLVHAFHHGTPANFPVRGSAEGIVDGKRVSRRLEFSRTSRTGVYALAKQWSGEGVWTLVVSAKQGPTDSVTAVVELAPSGQVASVVVPTERRDGYHIPKAVSMREVEADLRGRVARLAAR
jgi:hypothetical protein